MKKTVSAFAAALLCSGAAMAAPFTVQDFEGCEMGATFPMWNNFGDGVQTTATVVADPKDPSNKVLHIPTKGWNEFVEFTLPESLGGVALTSQYEYLIFDVYFDPGTQGGQWLQFKAFYGDDELYVDDGYPAQGEPGSWMKKTYSMKAPSDGSNAVKLRLGYNNDKTDYYIDNVTLKGRYDDYVTPEDGKLDICNPASTSSAYTEYSTPLNIPKGTTLDVYTSRYTYWTSPVIGEGTLNIHSAGERCYLGSAKGASYPDWSGYTGDIHVYGYPEGCNSTCGFYGLIMAAGSNKFYSDNMQESINKRDFTPIFENNCVTLHDGATLASENKSPAAGYRIGTLITEKGSHIQGYYKTKSDSRTYYIVGCSGKDSRLDGEIAPTGASKVGIVKEGDGTYAITGNTNDISGGLAILKGAVSIMNDIEAARSGKLSGAVGSASEGSAAVTVYPAGTLSGTGNIGGLTDTYGTVQPGSSEPGTLTIADFKSGSKPDLRVRPTARLRFRINSASQFDRLDISGALTYYNKTLGLLDSEQLPVLEIAADESSTLNEGDKFTLITASSGKKSLNEKEWQFRVQYPKVCTWKVEEAETEGGYTLTATVTSLKYSGQGDETIIITPEDSGDNTEYIVDYSSDINDGVSLKEYAAKAGKRIGVAVSNWRYDLSDANNPKVKAIADQFNSIVAENQMKFDATEPSQGNFNYGDADAIMSFAQRAGMYVRGHAFAWHSQCPEWVSSNGYKNNHNWSREQLIAILNNHIENVGGYYKGKVHEWDVINEMLDDDQSVVRDNPDSYKLRESVWQTVIGEEYMKLALVKAHEVDPDAKLFINEYGAEFMGDPKSEALFNLAKKLKESGAPLHGVGLQCHLTVGEVKADKLADNIRRYQDLGLEVIITELDIAQLDPTAPDAASRQAEEYGALVNAALSQPNCPSVTLWGISDPDSWRANKPLLYDADMNPKEAFHAVHAAVRLQAEKTSGIEEVKISAESEIIRTEYYNIQGMRVSPSATGIIIKCEYHSDGTVTRSKEYRR